jgi:hypothetical protein
MRHDVCDGSRRTSSSRVTALTALPLFCVAAAFSCHADDDGRGAPISSGQTALMIVLDVSQSMAALDLAPNRLGFCRDVVTRLVTHSLGMRIGLITFAGESRENAAVSGDYRILIKALSRAGREDYADGTAIGVGLAQAAAALRDVAASRRAILLLTDGVNNSGPLHPSDAVRLARHCRIRIHCVGIGRGGQVPMPVKAPNGKKRQAMVELRVDEPLLREIAKTTGGEYLRVTGDLGPESVVEAMMSRLLENDAPLPTAEPMADRSVRLLLGRLQQYRDTSPAAARPGKSQARAESPAQDNVIAAEINSQRIFMDEELELTLTLPGYSAAATPALPAMDGFSVLGTTWVRHSERAAGRENVSTGFTYRLKPLKTGMVEIPAVHYPYGGTTYTSSPVTVHVEPSVFPPPPSETAENVGEGPVDFKRISDADDDDPLTATIDVNRIGLQDVLNFHLTLRGTTDSAAPALPDIPGFRLLNTTHSARISVVKGVTRQSITFTYCLKPLRAGAFEIPAVTHRLLGQNHASKPLRVVVDQGGSTRPQPENKLPALELETQVSRTRVALGQSVDVRLVMYSANKVNTLKPISNQIFPGFWQEWLPTPMRTKTIKTTRDDKPCMYYQFRTARLWPLRVGKVEIPAMAFKPEFDMLDLVKSLVDPKQRKLRVVTTPVTIDVFDRDGDD